MLVLMHGYGGNERELFERIHPVVDDDVVLVALRGPVTEGAGHAWIPMETSLAAVTTEGIARVARDGARLVLDWLTTLPPFQSVGLLGVSQGAVLALHLLRLEPARFSYALNLSGYVLAGEEVGDAELRQRRPPVFWGRGEYDCVIPSSYVERTEKWLPLHSTVTANVYPVGHEESAPELADAAAFVRQMTRSRLHRSSNRSG